MMNAIEMRNIEKFYDGRTVLSVDDFFVEKNESVALVGPNGSGKTTLMTIAALLLTPDRGQVAIDDEIVNWRFPDRLRNRITLVAQEPYFFKGSLIRNMMFGFNGQRHNRKQMMQSIYMNLKLLGLESIAGRTPSTFSTGEKKRAAIARALCRKTPIILLDEPFAHVDNQSASVIHEVIKSFANSRTIIFTTHELARAYDIADRIVSLHDGCISPWTPENLYRLTAKSVTDGTELMTQSGLSVYYPYSLKDGEQYKATINPREIVLSINELESSAQNKFKGVIRKIEAAGENLVEIKIVCAADFIITATVTSRTIKAFNCTVGDSVWVNFKSAAVHVFE